MFHSSKNTFPFIASALGPSPRPVAGPAAAAHASHLETLWGPCRPSACALCGLDSGTPDSRPSSGLSSCCESLSPSGRHEGGGTWGRGDPLSSCALPGPRLGTTPQCGTLRPSLADQTPAACCLARLSLHGHRRAAVSAGSHGPRGLAWSFGEAADGWQRVSPILILPLAGPASSGKGSSPSESQFPSWSPIPGRWWEGLSGTG